MRTNLVFYVEGQTEEEFVKEVLMRHLYDKGIICHSPILVANSFRKRRISRAGLRSYGPAKKGIEYLLKQYNSPDFRFTTLIDLYGLPDDFPGQSKYPPGATGRDKAKAVADAWKQDVGDRRFMPFVFSHEFETLVLSDPDSLLAVYPGSSEEIDMLKQEIAGCAPEDINDSPKTAPSKRILRHIPNYDKVVVGSLAVMEIGLDGIRSRCPHFNEWMNTMENL